MKTTAVNIAEEGLGARPVKDVRQDLTEALKGASLWDCLDYFELSKAMQKRQNALFPRYEWISCAPVTSGSHHYVYIGAVFNGRHNLVLVGRTSKGFERACQVANRCARELGA
jgi:hypothetical protein